ncbi:MAG: nucleotidyltransferase domain-containing protein [Candidatus Binatia bacterium]
MKDLPIKRVPAPAFDVDDPAVRSAVDEAMKDAGIGLAVVHGSRARGSARPSSDLDVAVLGRDSRPLPYSRMGLLAADLSRLLSSEVDVSDLATPDAIFRFEVVRCAKLLYQDRPDAFSDFVAKTLIDYNDIQRFLPELIAGVARAAHRASDTDPDRGVDK